MSLAAALLHKLEGPPAADRAPDADLEAALAQLWAGVNEAHPGFSGTSEAFAGFLGERIPAGADPVAWLRDAEVNDLYLAFGLSLGDPVALKVFDRDHLPRIVRQIARSEADSSFGDDLKQALRERLLLPHGGQAPRVSGYRGHGGLQSWVRAVAARLAVDLRRGQRPNVALDETEVLADRAASPELAYFKLRYGTDFREAFRASLELLSSRDRALLRLHFIEGLTTAALAEMYGVSRWTARRWIDETCARILEATSQELARRLGLPPAELTTFVRALESQIAGTLTTFLRSDK